jgi:hypothetical protein
LEKNETDQKSTSNATSNLARQLDLIGPSVDDDIRRAISRHGADAVLESAKRQCGRQRGRPKVNEWPELRPIILAEAKDWLAGKDPIAVRTANSIAEEIADKNPGHNRSSTVSRIRRKLNQTPHGRYWQILVCAYRVSEEESYPYARSVRALGELRKIDGHSPWGWMLEQASFHIREYEAKTGEQPPANLSMKEVEAVARKPLRPSKGMMAEMQSDYTVSQGGLLSFSKQQSDEKN